MFVSPQMAQYTNDCKIIKMHIAYQSETLLEWLWNSWEGEYNILEHLFW